MYCSYEKTKDICKGQHWLLACNSGVLEEGIAQQLADLLQVPILAPTNTVFTSADGYVAVAEDYDEAVQIMSQMSNEKVKFMLDGWKLFTPKGE